jgi:plastocyanin
VCTFALYAIGPSAVAGGKSVSHTVVIQGLKNIPETLAVKRGDTIRWINKDPFPHTVTAKGVFDSGSIAPGGSWRYTAKIAGEHSYTCTFHPNMKGTLRVE